MFEEVKNLSVTRHRILINRKHVPVKKQQCRAGEQTSLLIFQEIASTFSVQCTRDCIHKCWNDAHPVRKQWPLPLLLYCFTVIGEDKIVRGTLPDKKKDNPNPRNVAELFFAWRPASFSVFHSPWFWVKRGPNSKLIHPTRPASPSFPLRSPEAAHLADIGGGSQKNWSCRLCTWRLIHL